jgi:netrin-G3 ligand
LNDIYLDAIWVEVYAYMIRVSVVLIHRIILQEQYTFCHDAILESIQCGNTQILAHDLRIALSKMDNVDKDLKMTQFEAEFKVKERLNPYILGL